MDSYVCLSDVIEDPDIPSDVSPDEEACDTWWFFWRDMWTGYTTLTVKKIWPTDYQRSVCIWAKTGYENDPDALKRDIKTLKSGKLPADGAEDPERLEIEMIQLAPAEMIKKGKMK